MKYKAVLFFAVFMLFESSTLAQRSEVGFTIGAMKVQDNRFEQIDIKTNTSFALQVAYSIRLFGGKPAALYADLPLTVGTKTQLDVSIADVDLPRSFSSLFFTPGLKVKIVPGARVSPYVVGGAGVARLKASDTAIRGDVNLFRDRSLIADAYSFGGGVDVKATPLVSLRGEVRNFRIGSSLTEINLFEKKLNSLTVTGGVVLRF